MSLSCTLVHQNRFRHAGSVRDLSAKGCCLNSIISPFTGMQLTIHLHIPGESKPIIVDNAAVRWSGSAGIGLEFLTVAPSHQDQLGRIIERLIQELQIKPGLQ
ncbi:MAG: PilZ domain-containing protein [Nitrospiraceae bacterium]|nr:PilZ domain-containing protein [Nitrospiraceae bacterium]